MNGTVDNVTLEYAFPGLRPFQEGEEHLFFGREHQTDAMIDKLRVNRFLAVIGTSGCGKSSLVNCGLFPSLYGGLMPNAGTAWKIAACRPGDNPIASLAKALAKDGVLFSQFDTSGVPLADIIESNLRMSKLGIIDIFEQSRQSDDTNLLVVIDQFEELFRFDEFNKTSGDIAKRAREETIAFVKLLLTASAHLGKKIYVVLTMRSDFLGECTRIEGLTEAINDGQYLVPRLTRQQRKLAISGPVRVAGARIDDVLLTRLVNDLGHNPDQLSILQHALNRIWANWKQKNDPTQPLTRQNYSAIGSMTDALNRHADKALSELKEPYQQEIAQRLFKALTDKTTNGVGVRRPTSLQTLCDLTACKQDELIKIMSVFRKPSRSFLMPPIEEEVTPDTIIDISHESLMRMWKKLIDWSKEEAISTQMYRRLATDAARYEQKEVSLWRDPELQLALEWRNQNQPNETWASRIAPGFDKAMQFLDESRAQSDEEEEERSRVAEQNRELAHAIAIANEQELRIEAQNKASKRQKYLFTSVVIGLIASLFLVLQVKNSTGELETAKGDLEAVTGVLEIVKGVLVEKTGELETAKGVLKTTSD